MADKVTLLSCNVNGLRLPQRRADVISNLLFPRGKKSPDIFFFQESHGDKQDVSFWTRRIPYKCYFTEASNNRGGLIVGVAKHLTYRLFDMQSDVVLDGDSPIGEYLLLHCSINNVVYVLVNVYLWQAPSNEVHSKVSQFWRKLFRKASGYGVGAMCFGGDFNMIASDADSSAVRPPLLQSLLQDTGLEDVWRILHPGVSAFTHHSSQSAARIDYFLASGLFCQYVESAYIDIPTHSDHSPIYCNLFGDRSEKGPGVWRFPNFLCFDEKFYSQLKDHLEIVAKENEIGNITTWVNNVQFIREAPEHVPEKLQSGVAIWETLKCAIRDFTARYISVIRKEGRFAAITKLKVEFQQKLSYFDSLENPYEQSELYDEICQLKKDIVRAEKICFKQSRWRGFVRNTTFARSTPKSLYSKISSPSGAVRCLIDESGMACDTDENILARAKQFYDNLYSTSDLAPLLEDPDNFFEFPQASCLTFQQRRELSADITTEEIEAALKRMKAGKSPGSDGLTVEFYKKFWPLVSKFVLQCISEFDDDGLLGFSQRQGLLKLLPKKGKNPHFIENHRPITLLNVDYKLFTSVLAGRLNELLPQLIHPDQRGFVKNRLIGDNLMDLYTLLANADTGEDESYALFSLDIYKAFDSVSWVFLDRVLRSLRFPSRFINWVTLTRKNKVVKVLNNGHYSEALDIHRGLPQGDGLSPGLFLLAIESLANKIRAAPNIKGMLVPGMETPKKLNLVADDTLITAYGSMENIRAVLDILDRFSGLSGLKINRQKSIILPVGREREPEWLQMEELRDFQVYPFDRCFKYLGIMVGNDSMEASSLTTRDLSQNVTDAIHNIRSPSTSISMRNLQIKALVASRCTYVFSHTQYLYKFHGKIYQRMLNFIWDGGRHRMNKLNIQAPNDQGGFNVLDPGAQEIALKFKWLMNALSPGAEDDLLWVRIFKKAFIVPIDLLLRCNIDYFYFLYSGLCNIPPILETALRAWFGLNHTPADCRDPERIRDMLSYAIFPDIPATGGSKDPFVNNDNSLSLNFQVLQFLYAHDMYRIGDLVCNKIGNWSLIQKAGFEEKVLEWVSRIPSGWLALFEDARVASDTFVDNHLVSYIKTGQASVKFFRQKLIPLPDFSKRQKAWGEELGFDIGTIWQKLFSKAKVLCNKKLLDFHIQFLTRSYWTDTVASGFFQMCLPSAPFVIGRRNLICIYTGSVGLYSLYGCG